jgi:hypothetical protein
MKKVIFCLYFLAMIAVTIGQAGNSGESHLVPDYTEHMIPEMVRHPFLVNEAGLLLTFSILL